MVLAAVKSGQEQLQQSLEI